MDIHFILGIREQITIHNKGSRKNKQYLAEDYFRKDYYWDLSRYVGEPTEYEECIPAAPSRDIGQGLTEDWLTHYLNLNELNFGLECQIQQGDTLEIYSVYIYPKIRARPRPHDERFMHFEFRDGLWQFTYPLRKSIYKNLAARHLDILAK